MTKPHIALLAQGKLFFLNESGETVEWKSPFAEQVAERHLKIEQKHAWKTEGRGARFMRGGMAWEMPELEAPSPVPVFTGLSAACDEEALLYTVQVSGVQGICRYRNGEELRLIHGSDHLPQDLNATPGQDFIASSVRHKDSTAHIVVLDREAGDPRELTDGDTVDICPSWVPDRKGHLVFQSAGIGRDAEGFPKALGPSHIQQLDIHTGDLRTLIEDPNQDFMAPQMSADGTLYCIRKPYGWKPSTKSFLRFVLDLILIPFRILRAIFQYLNFFSAKYTGKPLTTAGGPKKEGADLKQMWLYGNLINAQATLEEGKRKGDEAPGMVPKDWQLIRLKPGEQPKILASGVAGFAMAAGRLVTTNGSAIFELGPDGSSRKLHTMAGIQKVVLL